MATKAEVIITARDMSPQAFKSFEQNARRAIAAATKYGAVMAGAAVAGATIMVRRTLEGVDALAKQADKLGISTEALSAYHHAAELTGVSTNTMDMALQRFTRRANEAANGTGEARGALKELGIELRDSRGNVRATEALFADVADAMKKVEDPSTRLRLAFKLFDSEGAALVNTLRDGSDGLQRAREETERFGTAITRVDAAKIEAANDAITRAKEASRGLATQFTVALAPAITAATDALTGAGGGAGELRTKMEDLVEGSVFGFGLMLDGLAFIKVSFLEVSKAAVVAEREMNEFFSVGGGDQNLLTKALDTLVGGSPAGALLPLLRARMGDATEATREYNGQLNNLQAAIDQETNSLRMSEQLLRAVTKAKLDAAQATAVQRAAETGAGEGGGVAVDATLRKRIEALQQTLMTETELENAHYEERRELLARGLSEGLVTKQQYLALDIQLTADHQKRLSKIEAAGAKNRATVAESWMRYQVTLTSSLQDLSAAMMSSGSKKAFEVGKALAIASTSVNTIAGAVSAVTTAMDPRSGIPFPANLVLGTQVASLILATGGFRIAQIKAQQFGGAASLAAGAAISVPSVGAATSTPAVASQPAVPQTNIALSLTGSRFSAEDVTELIAQIEDQSRDGRTNIQVARA